MRKYFDGGGLAPLPPQLPQIIPPQFSTQMKLPTKLPTMKFPSTTNSKSPYLQSSSFSQIGNAAGMLNGLIPQKEQSGLTTGLNAGYDAAANAVGAIPGVGTAISGIMKIGGLASDALTAMGVGTDQMTTTDKVLDSKFLNPIGLINAFGAKKADTINKDNETFEQVGSSYTGTEGEVNDAVGKSGKKYGLLSNKARKRANSQIAEAKRKQNIVSGIAEEASDAFTNQRTSLDMLNSRNLLNMSGGYQQRGSYIGKNGLKFPSAENIKKAKKTAERIKKIKEEVRMEEVAGFKEGGKMNVIPDGALHAHKHHMEIKDITPKGIAVVSIEDGGIVQHAEIERNEIIFTKEVTEELERLYKDGSDEAAIKAGKLIAKQIIENTQDNTGLISEVQV